MSDSNVIATLIATTDKALQALQCEHNSDRYRPPILDDTTDRLPFDSREGTPYVEDDPEDLHDQHHRLVLSFDKPPKNPTHGFVFGWGPECDVQLVGDADRVPRVSRAHFSITFDFKRRVVIRGASINGTTVSYDGKGTREVRSQFIWIIFPDFKEIEVSIPKTKIAFSIDLKLHEESENAYFDKIDAVFPLEIRIGEDELATPLVGLDMRSQQTSVAPSGLTSPRQRAIYIKRRTIGKGSFGKVEQILNVSTGETCAGKLFYGEVNSSEVGILRHIDHDHIVRFVEFCEKPKPMLVMEYLPLGNLRDAHHARRFNFDETMAILGQSLLAVQYLNSCGIAHRDIKPANMLLACRDPITVKLADLGLAKDDRNGATNFKTEVGTPMYAAPDVRERGPYTYAVDIWSLGIVMLELLYGLPQYDSSYRHQPWLWYQKIEDHIRDLVRNFKLNALVEPLLKGMLRSRAHDRLTVAQCLVQVDHIETKRLEQRLEAEMANDSMQRSSKATSTFTPVMTVSVNPTDHGRAPYSSFQQRFEPMTAIKRENGGRETPDGLFTEPDAAIVAQAQSADAPAFDGARTATRPSARGFVEERPSFTSTVADDSEMGYDTDASHYPPGFGDVVDMSGCSIPPDSRA